MHAHAGLSFQLAIGGLSLMSIVGCGNNDSEPKPTPVPETEYASGPDSEPNLQEEKP